MKSQMVLSCLLALVARAVASIGDSTFHQGALKCTSKPPAFFLAGDSTTAVQSEGGGGWGNGFLSFLKAPAWGVNLGHNGATTVSFVQGGDWANVTDYVKRNTRRFDTYVTIQFGHNDQKPASNISLSQYQANLERLAREVKGIGGTPFLVTPLTRRSFVSEHQTDDSLHDQRLATIAAARATNTTYLDLNQASMNYANRIGNESAQVYNLHPNDTTHLNDYGSVVFGRLLADLMIEKRGCLERWIGPNETLSYDLWHGIPA
ncbi:Uu.00g006940.m01.CDS01 [Anthostomella pinea]|uniref:Uu.00g006940.m01.CDS01 n=1 Tax=Anthostomella pinea TaxID=933095 RepID=A0AAI8VKD4_9PEZI|nr:Uu.00g006940.m01.CDS01 [Anthostomella pinea]